MGTELWPIPRLSKAQTSMPPPLSLSSGIGFQSQTPPPPPLLVSSSLGKSLPTIPLICGPHDSWVPANPDHPNSSPTKKKTHQNSITAHFHTYRFWIELITKNSKYPEMKNVKKKMWNLWWGGPWWVHDHRFCKRSWSHCCCCCCCFGRDWALCLRCLPGFF